MVGIYSTSTEVFLVLVEIEIWNYILLTRLPIKHRRRTTAKVKLDKSSTVILLFLLAWLKRLFVIQFFFKLSQHPGFGLNACIWLVFRSLLQQLLCCANQEALSLKLLLCFGQFLNLMLSTAKASELVELLFLQRLHFCWRVWWTGQRVTWHLFVVDFSLSLKNYRNTTLNLSLLLSLPDHSNWVFC